MTTHRTKIIELDPRRATIDRETSANVFLMLVYAFPNPTGY
jgi:hypothetical protein